MAITRFRNSTISNRTPKYNDVLAGLPFRPIIGTASDGGNGTSASVAFTGNNVANGTITYTALSSPGSFTGTGTASPITVSGLTAGTAYTFQVKAGNSLGDSAYSAASNSVTPVTPTAFESIASATGTGSSGTITFSSIPGTYQHLQIRGNAIPSTANGTQQIAIRLNGATGTYRTHYISGNSSSVEAGTNTTTSIRLNNQSSLGSSTYPVVFIIDIHDYASTTKNKVTRHFTGQEENATGAVTPTVELSSGLWVDTSAITSVTILMLNANFTTSSTISLYGIKA